MMIIKFSFSQKYYSTDAHNFLHTFINFTRTKAQQWDNIGSTLCFYSFFPPDHTYIRFFNVFMLTLFLLSFSTLFFLLLLVFILVYYAALSSLARSRDWSDGATGDDNRAKLVFHFHILMMARDIRKYFAWGTFLMGANCIFPYVADKHLCEAHATCI